ncbi:hypothetical protein [Okeania sp. KiyG1]|nr:hypothetical protein [Okeania sp. KiyG1]
MKNFASLLPLYKLLKKEKARSKKQEARSKKEKGKSEWGLKPQSIVNTL